MVKSLTTELYNYLKFYTRGKLQVWWAVQVKTDKPGMSCINKSLHITKHKQIQGNFDSTWEVLGEIFIQYITNITQWWWYRISNIWNYETIFCSTLSVICIWFPDTVLRKENLVNLTFTSLCLISLVYNYKPTWGYHFCVLFTSTN